MYNIGLSLDFGLLSMLAGVGAFWFGRLNCCGFVGCGLLELRALAGVFGVVSSCWFGWCLCLLEPSCFGLHLGFWLCARGVIFMVFGVSVGLA